MDLPEAENIKKRWQQQMESEVNQLCPTLCDPMESISQGSKVMLKILQAGFNSMWMKNFQIFKLDLEKEEEPEINLPTSDHQKSKRIPEKHLLLLHGLH